MRPWGRLQPPDHVVVLGVPQSGKTTFARRYLAAADRGIVFDPGHDYTGIPGVTVARPEKWPRPAFFAQDTWKIVVPGPVGDGDVVEEFCYVVSRAREIRNLLLVCDEVGDYSVGAGARALRNLHRNGHKQGIVTVLVSQRAVDIPLGARATATKVLSLLQDSEQDLEALHEVYDPSCPGFSDRVREWQPGEPPVVWERKPLWR
jgi:hypothetical protein